jgi:diguanylate cyclase (GGDEF)-like protein/PAS domain S-box-containing protein
MSGEILEAIVRLTLLGRISVQFASEEIKFLLGFTSEDLLTSRVNLKERIHAHDSCLAEALFRPEIQSGSGTFNLRFRHADSQIRCIQVQASKRDEGGQVVLELLLQDVRSLKAESDQLPMLANFKAMMENTDDYIYFKDRNHVFTSVSKNMTALDLPHENTISSLGHTDYDLMPEEYADVHYSLEDQILSGISLSHHVQQMISDHGRIKWLDDRKYPVRNSHGEIIGLFGIARDITERVQVEETVRESEILLKEAQRAAGLGSYVVDFGKREVTCSEVMNEIFGARENLVKPLDEWTAIIHPDDLAMVNAYYQDEILGQGKDFDQKCRVIRPSDQAVRWVHGLGRLEFDAQLRPVKMRGTIRDITESKQVEIDLNESKELLQEFIEHAPVSLAMFDCEMRYLGVSQRYVTDNSLEGAEIIGRSYYEIFPYIPECWKEAHRRGLLGEELQINEDRYEDADKAEHWIRWQLHPWRRGNGVVGGLVIFSEDITERRKTEEKLRLAASVFTHAREGILITGADGAIIEVNDVFCQSTGYSREEVVGRNPRILNSGRQGKEFYESMWRTLLESGHWSGEIWNRSKVGHIYPGMLTISAVLDERGAVQHYVALFSDITALKEHERQLEHFAHHDMLTGLPNRVLLADRLNQAIVQSHRHGKQVVVAYLDLDGFKEINDTHGHDAGDQLLAIVAGRMKTVLRKGDTLARMGGDEFIAVLLDLENTETSLPLLSRLLRAASQPVQISDYQLQVTASIGVTTYPQIEEADADLLLRQADQAMYQAKQAGKNRYHIFNFKQDRNARNRQIDIDRIRMGLSNREFVLYYQPKVNMCKGTVVGAEALIRWQHPERGLMLPGTFLPMIEDHPMAVVLGEWVIDTALAQMEHWQTLGLNISVSVNVGARQLQEPDFADRLAALLVAHPRVKPSSLELEIVETSELEEMSQVSQMLEGCRELGVMFALDDFGTGYSSLSYLKQLPADVLKIDQSFVRNILEDPEDLTILEGVLGLAAAFRRSFIAEGVETAEQGLMLLRMGCELAQGFGIARPMPAEDFPHWATTWRPDPRWLNVLSASKDERQLIYAAVEHRAWIMAIEAFLKGERHVPPRLSVDQCRFSLWMASEGFEDQEENPEFQQLEELHEQIHALAVNIVKYRDREIKQDLMVRLNELHSLRDALLEQLEVYKRVSHC